MSITFSLKTSTISSIPNRLVSELIIPFAGNINTTKNISKAFQKITRQSLKFLIESYKQHPKLSKIAAEYIQQEERSMRSDPLTDHQYFLIANRTYQKIARQALSLDLMITTHFITKYEEEIREESIQIDLTSLLENLEARKEELNLIAFFGRLSQQIPEGQRPHFERDPTKFLIRSWLAEHQILLNSITTLDLSNLGLTELPSDIALFTRLLSLNLSNNQLTTLPPQIALLKNLIGLTLSNNQIASLPDVICEFAQLQLLMAANNQLTTLPEKFGQLTKLRFLDLSSNQLLFGNQIEFFPATFSNLKNLTILNLTGMQLTSMPHEICALVNLENLYLSRNQLSALPEAFQQLKHLTTLDLSYNQFSILPPKNLPLNIEFLDVSGNELMPVTIELI